MAKLVDMFRLDKGSTIKRRQLPLVIGEKFTMIMDISSVGLMCDSPALKGRILDDFMRKYTVLNTPEEVKSTFQVTYDDVSSILNQTVSCVGCRKSVERLFYQLMKFGHPTLDPLVVTSGGLLTVREDKITQPQSLCAILLGYRYKQKVKATNLPGTSCRLQYVFENQPRSKKSKRCILHSLESNRSRAGVVSWREVGVGMSSWRDVWDCMKNQCREEVAMISFQTLQETLDNYLRKHRFCAECKTKVIRAYQLLVEEKEPQMEKGYVSSLYAGIRRCLAEKHLHLQAKTEYISDLIMRAEPELLGSHGDSHAKTMEIAQEEVLVCLGICVYDRLHRISLKLREEEGTCQVLAAAAVDALHRKFETVVERKTGVTKLELLYDEITKEEVAKQQRKELKKLRKRKKKERLQCENKCIEEGDNADNSQCGCADCAAAENEESCEGEPLVNNNIECLDCCRELIEASCKSCQNSALEDIPNLNRFTRTVGKKGILNKKNVKGSRSSSEMSQDCGYSSGYTNGCCDTVSSSSSLPSSPEGSDVACSEGFCNHDRGDCAQDVLHHSKDGTNKTCAENFGTTMSLQDMLLEASCSDEEQDNVSYIPMEEVMEFKARQNITEKREELRQALRNKFAQLFVTPSPAEEKKKSH